MIKCKAASVNKKDNEKDNIDYDGALITCHWLKEARKAPVRMLESSPQNTGNCYKRVGAD